MGITSCFLNELRQAKKIRIVSAKTRKKQHVFSMTFFNVLHA